MLRDIYMGGPFISMGFVTVKDQRTMFIRRCQWFNRSGDRCENEVKQMCGDRAKAVCGSHYAAYEESLASASGS